MFDWFNYISHATETVINFFNYIPSYFEAFFIYLEVWWIKIKVTTAIYFLRTSFLVATALLDDIGFNTLFAELFNKLPSELRYWATLFKVPEGVSLYVNCATTALVLRMSR